MISRELEESFIPFQVLIINNINSFNVEGVTSAQYEILDILKDSSKTTNELAEIRKISQPGVSKLTKRLLEKKYIKQVQNVDDGRVFDIYITDEGKEFLKRIQKFRNKIISVVEERLDEDECKEFVRLLNKIND